MTNPLLHQGALPIFSPIIPEQHIEDAVKTIIQNNRQQLADLLANNQPSTWENLMAPLEDMADQLAKTWAPVAHLHGVAETEALRKAYNAVLPLLTEYNTELMQNEKLFQKIEQLSQSHYPFNAAQRKILDNELRDFRLAGVHLPTDKKARFAELQKQLSQLCTQFAENVLDATHAFSLHITDDALLKGLPAHDVQIAKETAEQQGKPGWILTLEYPCYAAVMKFLENRDLRQRCYEAYVTRASDQGPHANHWDNSSIMENILKIRHELALLLGFQHYAELSLATKMAEKPEQVLQFIHDLVNKSKPAAMHEIETLRAFAQSVDNMQTVEAWDIAFYSEKLRQQQYALSQEEIKPYFPATKVMEGMFQVMHKLFGIRIVAKTGVDIWDPLVNFFEIYDQNQQLRGYFYTDLYSRPRKRDGAWMDEARVRRHLPDGSLQLPVAFLTCNFPRPTEKQPSLLSQDDVETLFHEFGHCLHHLLTQIDYAGISGINGVPWDAVEFPSQMMERWCLEKETIKLISSHYETNATLPDDLYQKMLVAKYFQSGLHMLRQLEFALFDFKIHLEYHSGQIQTILDGIRAEVAAVTYPSFNRFQHSFSHIFAGGYAAGYYSYKWSEVLSSDAYSLFEEKGVFNADIGQSYLQHILEQGGLRHPMQNFVAFRGREPQVDALLKHHGLLQSNC